MRLKISLILLLGLLSVLVWKWTGTGEEQPFVIARGASAHAIAASWPTKVWSGTGGPF